jgi:transposase-like protein
LGKSEEAVKRLEQRGVDIGKVSKQHEIATRTLYRIQKSGDLVRKALHQTRKSYVAECVQN